MAEATLMERLCWTTCSQIPRDSLALGNPSTDTDSHGPFLVEGVGWELRLVSGACCHGSWGSQQ